jgi:hypothetical protein
MLKPAAGFGKPKGSLGVHKAAARGPSMRAAGFPVVPCASVGAAGIGVLKHARQNRHALRGKVR